MRTSRRKFFASVGAGAAGLTIGTKTVPAGNVQAYSASGCADSSEPVLRIGENIAVTETTSGRVRGYVLRGINYFLGIPYGADTSGANRFMPPRKPEPWKDVYQAIWWGNSAPQNMEKRYANAFASFRDHWNYDDVSEDCLRLNVFTPALKDGGKRPVLVWLHGGGFTNGNGIEQDGYNGENLARSGNVVFCSVNHRLGPLGYCNLAGVGGGQYAASGNVGMLDLVAALEWVRDNIESFGGDPGNVTIIGQSGGGGKVTTLTAMPSAKGLFHRAVVLSGAMVRSGDKDYAEKLGASVVAEAGLTAASLDKLQQLPWQEYYEIATKAQRKLAEEVAKSGTATRGLRFGFGPSVDGTILPQHPYDPAAAPTAADLPMIICSTENEMSMAWADASVMNMTLADVTERLKERAGFGPGLGDDAAAVVDSYARAFPDKKPYELWSLVSSNRQSVVTLADAKVKQPAPVFVSWFAWQPPLFDGRIGAFHCVDISFWFHNTDLMLTHSGGGARPRKLAEKMSASLVQFMKTGDPNGPGLTSWPKYTSAKGETLVLDDVCEVKNDPDREARKALPTT
jgi:para-nitrobenzyl esterase